MSMDACICFEDDELCCFLKAKRCMEVKLDKDMFDGEVVGRLAEHYLDCKKGSGKVYETDELE